MLLDVETLRNNNLRDIIHEIQTCDSEIVPDNLINKLCHELKMASFITPACGAGLLRLPASDENSSLIPIFTSLNEYNIEFTGANIEPISWNFNFYEELTQDFDDIEGIVVNPNIDNFFISSDIIEKVIDMVPHFNSMQSLKSTFSNEELHEIYDSENPEIDSFLDNYDGKDIEGLIDNLSKANLYTFLVTKENLGEFIRDGIIKTTDIRSQGIFTVRYGKLEGTYLFSNPKYIHAVQRFHEKNGWYIYAFPTTLELISTHLISLDLDYIFLNPNNHGIILTRDMLLENIDLIIEKCGENVKYDLGNYSFQLTKRKLRNRKRYTNKSFKIKR